MLTQYGLNSPAIFFSKPPSTRSSFSELLYRETSYWNLDENFQVTAAKLPSSKPHSVCLRMQFGKCLNFQIKTMRELHCILFGFSDRCKKLQGQISKSILLKKKHGHVFFVQQPSLACCKGQLATQASAYFIRRCLFTFASSIIGRTNPCFSLANLVYHFIHKQNEGQTEAYIKLLRIYAYIFAMK